MFKKKEEPQSQPSRREKREPRRRSSLINFLAFYCFVGAAVVLLLRTILTHFFGEIAALNAVATVIQIVLYGIAGILAFRHVRHSALRLVLFVLAAAILIASVVLPYFL